MTVVSSVLPHSAAEATVPVAEGRWFTPPNMVAGRVPRKEGLAAALVWHDACAAVGTERLQAVWTACGPWLYYVAAPAADFASHAGTLCPHALLLPTGEEAPEARVVLDDTDPEANSLFVLDNRGSVFFTSGAASRLEMQAAGQAERLDVPVERMSRLLGSVPARPWVNLNLQAEHDARRLLLWGGGAGLAVAALGLVVWIGAMAMQVSYQADKAIFDAQRSAAMQEAVSALDAARTRPLAAATADMLRVHDGVQALGGWLQFYRRPPEAPQRAEWQAEVPRSATSDRIERLGARTGETTDRSTIIRNFTPKD